METFVVMLKNVIIFVLLAIPGYLLVKSKLMKAKDSGLLSTLLMYVGMPALILGNTLSLELTGKFALSLIIMALISVMAHLLMFFTTKWLCSHEEDAGARAMMRFGATFANSGFVGIPLAMAVFPGDAVLLAYLTVCNIVMNVTMSTLGAYLLTGDKSVIRSKKALLSPIMLSFLAGIVLNCLGVAKAVPEVSTLTNHLKGLVTPLAMVVLGMKLADVSFKQMMTSQRMYYVSLLRLVLYPIVATAVILLLQKISFLEISRSGVMGFFMSMAMPTATLAVVFADQYRADGKNAAFFALGTTILSVLTIPVLYALLIYVQRY